MATEHNHEDAPHTYDISLRCCCCGAGWTPVPFPQSGTEMIHADDCEYINDDYQSPLRLHDNPPNENRLDLLRAVREGRYG